MTSSNATPAPGGPVTIRAYGVTLNGGEPNREPIAGVYAGRVPSPWRNYATGEPMADLYAVDAADGTRYVFEGESTFRRSVFPATAAPTFPARVTLSLTWEASSVPSNGAPTGAGIGAVTAHGAALWLAGNVATYVDPARLEQAERSGEPFSMPADLVSVDRIGRGTFTPGTLTVTPSSAGLRARSLETVRAALEEEAEAEADAYQAAVEAEAEADRAADAERAAEEAEGRRWDALSEAERDAEEEAEAPRPYGSLEAARAAARLEARAAELSASPFPLGRL